MSIQIVDASATSNRRLNGRSLVGSRASGEWTRPSEWPALPPITASDEKFVGVYAVFDLADANFVALSAAGNYTVDWGDGTVENISSGVTAQHQYTYSNANLTYTSYGYKCAVVTVTPQAGQQLTSLNLNRRHSTLNQVATAEWLDIAISLPNCSASGLTIGASTSVTLRHLQRVQAPNVGNCTSMANLLKNCYSLQSVSLNTAAVANMNYMFSACTSLQSISLNTAAATNMSYMFDSCYSLKSVSLNTAAATNMISMFSACTSLRSIPALNQSAITSGNGVSFADWCSSLSSSSAYGIKYSIGYQGCSLSKSGLETIFTNLGKAYNTSQAITITSNYGADTAVSKASCTTTAGSTTVTLADTSNLVTGMICTGTGISTGVAVTFQDSGDTVTLAGHGLANGTMISFSAITSTTGIATYTNYWVVNATANTFQVASTQGGNALALTTDGSGTLLYPAYVVTINTNTSVVLSAPASANGTVTLSFRKLDTFKATSKGWTITG